MHALILTIHIIVCLMLVGFVLIQHGKGADAGAAFGGGGGGGGASGSLFGSQGSASFLSRTSAILAAIFFMTSLTLAYFSVDRPDKAQSVTQTAPAEQKVEETPADLPELP
ncbi:Preprotein translocase subunit SecG [Methylophaga thiooxydans]|uniref:Protein-export membrane protein SecG n=1 Tax=Methylophaga thiooxydans TaxID=392484 RepID=A0A0A0BJV1_9GAMM|nr:preprotein translocase subunit SecG [Methylophaga thiooxydans]KGM07384.1 Preprotein translocase subunit SecG [Methylophaga thiooxydans]